MGKIFVLSVTDHEEYILSRIMEIIAAEPGFDHTVSSHPCNILVFPVPIPEKQEYYTDGMTQYGQILARPQ